MSDQGIWWEDLLQTTTVRFHRSNKLTEFFGIPSGDELEKPMFIFGKRRQEFNNSTSKWARLSTNSREEFENWMWNQIKVEVVFVNNHDHPVEVFWIHGRSAKVQTTLQPGEEGKFVTMLSHEFWVRDARTDTFHDTPGRGHLTVNNALISWKITSDEDFQRLVIPLRTCFDLSGHCQRWHFMGECHKNPRFMKLQCAKTCDECIEATEPVEGHRERGSGHDEF
jgi:ShK domain-like